VGQVAVIGIPDRRMGEVGLALVVPPADGAAPGLEDDLAAWARQHLANYKVPRAVRLVDALPVNAGGKVLKRELRLQYAPTGEAG
jgi:acyl-CoA synthetase (AMP-forming)/AMP-acid ligase II